MFPQVFHAIIAITMFAVSCNAAFTTSCVSSAQVASETATKRQLILHVVHDEFQANDSSAIADNLMDNMEAKSVIPMVSAALTFSPDSKKDRKVAGQRVEGFLKGARKDSLRVVHSTLGAASLAVGFHHLLEIAMVHSFAYPMEISDAALAGTLHSIVGLFGVRRLHFKDKKEAARNAMIWPVPLQNMWFTLASLTEWGQGSDPVLSMFDGPFVAFSVLMLVSTVWQLFEVQTKSDRATTKDEIWLEDPTMNSLLIEFVYLFWLQVQMVALLIVSVRVDHENFVQFMDQFPEMHCLLTNIAINSAFLSNVVILFATVIRYKLVSKPVFFSAPILLAMFTLWKLMLCFLGTNDGEMASSFFSLVLH